MSQYSRGDVVFVHYPYRDFDGTLKTKPRPAVILDVSGNDHYVIKCTTKNRSDKLKGVWVLSSSPEGVEMGFRENTFINLTETITLKGFAIIRKIGDCPILNQLEDLLDDV